MKNKGFLATLTAVMLATPMMFGASFAKVETPVEVNAAVGNYYDSIGAFDTGDDLLAKLRELNGQKRTRLISYDNMWSYFSQTDPYSSYGVMSFYDGSYCGSTYTREHIWPFSRLFLNNVTGNERGDNDIEKDLYEIRPCSSSINEGRNNKFYGYETNDNLYDPGQYGKLDYRGDAARIIFYCVIADENLHLSENENDGVMQRSMGKLSTLLEWNLQYAVTSRELTRNNAVQDIQGHRNPFVDHPEYACRIWGNTNMATKKVCASHGFEKELTVKWDTSTITSIAVPNDGHRDLSLYLNNSKVSSDYTLSFVDPTYGFDITSDIAELNTEASTAVITGKNVGTGLLKASASYTLSNGNTETLSKYIDVKVANETNLSDLEVSGNYKKEYVVGDTFDSTGMIVTAIYGNGMKQDVTKYVTLTNTALNSPRQGFPVRVTYQEGTASLSITVRVNVSSGSTPTGGSSNGCGGNIATTSITLAAISLLGISFLAFATYRRKKKE